jgi:hypothetical protein
MFSSWFGGKSGAKKQADDIPAKIADFNRRLTQENMGLVEKKATLQMLVNEKGRGVMNTPTAVRLVNAMKRNHAMMKVYSTSLSALEATQQNMEMQRVTAEVQKLIGRAGRADFDSVEDSLDMMQDMNIERQQLANLMVNDQDDDDDDFIAELGLQFPDETSPAPQVIAPAETLPSPPGYLVKPATAEEKPVPITETPPRPPQASLDNAF